mmetsp:Transcript_24646/g.75136  ORF Transcript_24646/g.75136 Transcript_24646/m.75136 type:complete len:230 (-) Transcript_24646:252-941(-)|eukprot:scaffold95215_cov26-Tisochrysis_lutea.AAC.6
MPTSSPEAWWGSTWVSVDWERELSGAGRRAGGGVPCAGNWTPKSKRRSLRSPLVDGRFDHPRGCSGVPSEPSEGSCKLRGAFGVGNSPSESELGSLILSIDGSLAAPCAGEPSGGATCELRRRSCDSTSSIDAIDACDRRRRASSASASLTKKRCEYHGENCGSYETLAAAETLTRSGAARSQSSAEIVCCALVKPHTRNMMRIGFNPARKQSAAQTPSVCWRLTISGE